MHACKQTHTASGPISDKDRVNWHGWFPRACATYMTPEWPEGDDEQLDGKKKAQ
jgi:hypothetical protein